MDKLSPMGNNIHLIEVRQAETYARWFKALRDHNAKGRIDIRIRRVSLGNFRDVKAVGEGVWELRVDYGPGYRIYYMHRGAQIVILLYGGDKRTQLQDIKRARMLAETV